MLSLLPGGLFTYAYVQFSTNMGLKHEQVRTRGSLFFLPDSLRLLLFCSCDVVQGSWKCVCSHMCFKGSKL